MPIPPPLATKCPVETILHDETLIDDYAWLKEKANPETIAYLEAENAFARASMEPSEGLQETLYAEMVGRIKQTDLSVPYPRGDYLYYSRTEEGKQYAIYCRKRGDEGSEEILLDVNALAEGKGFMSVGAFVPSDDGRKLAFSTDETGYRQYRLQVRDLESGIDLPFALERVTSVRWATDNETLLFSTEDETTKRSDRVWRQGLVGEPALVYEEVDALFTVYVGRTLDQAYFTLHAGSSESDEIRLIPADRPDAESRVVTPRQDKLEYDVEHREGLLYIRTNKEAKDFRVMTAPVESPGIENWSPFIEPIADGKIEGITALRDHLVITKRENGLPGLAVRDFKTGETHEVPVDEKVYALSPSINAEFATDRYRYTCSSPTTPATVVEIDLNSMERTILKQTEVLGGYDASLYATERVFAPALDGRQVPIGLTYRKDLKRIDGNPLLLQAYGAYGIPASFGFNSNAVSLMDRGFIVATAQIRGGGDMGEAWHDEGKMANKRNSFTDFVAAADHLVYVGFTTREKLAIVGGSAGGLLIGATLNIRPDLCRAAILYVPFVDVINTMLDETLPLTVGEFLEWGNPKVEAEYRVMRSYSPYENIRAARYPKMLVKTGLNDSQVLYHEPAKYVAKLRALAQPEELLFLTNMDAGHGGSSGRYDLLKERAFDYAFLVTALVAPSV
ncbi:oligopeptidase B [soil metagenome]